jgi:hypothetical protein
LKTGAFPTNKKRKGPDPERIKARLKAAPAVPEGVQPLNPGFFALEHMRASKDIRAAGRRTKKVKG